MKNPSEKIRALQREAARCTQELLDISTQISDCVLPAYNAVEGRVFTLQAKVNIERLRRLSGRLEGIGQNLSSCVDEFEQGTGVQAQVRDEVKRSADITRQLIAQNIAAAGQKVVLLQELIVSANQIRGSLDAAKKLEDTTDIMKLKEILAEMTD